MRTISTLAAMLMLGGISCAYAQGGPSEEPRGASERGPSAVQERSPGSDSGASEASGPSEKGSSATSERSEGSNTRASEKSEGGKKPATKDAAGSAEEKSTPKSAKSDSEGGSDRMSDDKKSGSPEKSAKSKDSSDTSRTTAGESSDKTEKSTETSQPAGTPAKQSAEGKASPDSVRQVNLTGEKRTRVQTAFHGAGDVKRRTGVNISISVGARLPRDWDYVPVPVAVIEVVPEYRGYLFVYVEDEYVICDPDTYEVVAVIPAERSYAAGSGSDRSGGSKCSSQLTLNADDRELILQSVRAGNDVSIPDLSVGNKVPRDVQLLTFPDSVLREASELGSCKYFDAGDQIAIVDPDQEKIVLIIDKG